MWIMAGNQKRNFRNPHGYEACHLQPPGLADDDPFLPRRAAGKPGHYQPCCVLPVVEGGPQVATASRVLTGTADSLAGNSVPRDIGDSRQFSSHPHFSGGIKPPHGGCFFVLRPTELTAFLDMTLEPPSGQHRVELERAYPGAPAQLCRELPGISCSSRTLRTRPTLGAMDPNWWGQLASTHPQSPLTFCFQDTTHSRCPTYQSLCNGGNI